MRVYLVSTFHKLFQIEEFGFIIKFIFQNYLKEFLGLINDSTKVKEEAYEKTIKFWIEKMQ